MELRFKYPKFIQPALFNNVKYTTIRAGRRTGKTLNTAQWLVEDLMASEAKSGLWVETTHTNIDKYIERYFIPILKPLGSLVEYNQQKKILTLPNKKYIDFGSAERPENLEGFQYDRVVLNEAGIILKKQGLWENTILAMTKGESTKVKIIGTPKGRNQYYNLCSITDSEWEHFQFTAYDSPFWDIKELELIKNSIADYVWRQEYLAEFVDSNENSLIASEDIEYYENLNLDDFDNLFIHADITHTGKQTSDYFSLVCMGESKKDKKYYLIDFVLEKQDVEAQARSTISMFQKFQKKVKKITYDEKGHASFGHWTQKLAREEFSISLPIEPLKYPSDKVQHFTPHVPHFKSKRVVFPKEAPNLQIATNQLLAFPSKSSHDDFVDGLSGVLDNFKSQRTRYSFGAV